MSLVSHELRTLVAVISGAIQVLYRRSTLSADELVKMLLINLIQNALQHTQPQPQITIQIDSEKIEILDQGPGLPASIQEKLQQQNKKLRLSQSSGLGLYIVTLICERLKWKLVLENAEQSGTKACIFFVNPVHH